MDASVPQPFDVVKLPLSLTDVHTVRVEGIPYVVLRPAVEDLGMTFSPQLQKLQRRSWATMSTFDMVAEDGKIRQMVCVDVRTFLMWSATVPTSRVTIDKRSTLEAYQSETADVIEAYWTRGGAINPRADHDQLEALKTRIAEREAEIRELAPDAHAYRVLAGSGIAYDMKTAADILRADPNIDIGRTRLFARLREMGFLNTKNEPLMKKGQYVVSGANEIVVKDNPTYYRDRITGEIRKGRAKTLLTYKGLRLMHDDLGGTQPLMITESEIIR